MTIKLVVKPTAGGEKLSVEVEADATVLAVKEQLAGMCSIPADSQRLIYKGQILKDERTVDSYGLGNDHVLHLVRGRPQGNIQSGPSAAQPPIGSSTPAAADPFMGAMGGMNPEVVQQMMQSPMMQQVLNNPQFMTSVLQNNPAVRELMDRNPELAQTLNDPAMMRQAMQLMSNPNLMREYMRNNDRAISNIEALPGGFNALRNLYENVQEPLLNATTGANAAASQQASQGSGGASATSTTAAASAPQASDPSGTSPLPNPWAPPAASGAPAASGGAPAGLGGLGLPGLAGLGGAGGGMGGMGGMDLQGAAQMLQDPGMQAAMQSMLSQPGMVEAMVNSNPMMRSMMDSNPQMREMLSNPDTLRAMLDPANVQAMLQMNQAMQALQGNPMFGNMAGLMGGLPGAAPGGNAAGAGAPGAGAFDISGLMSALGGMGAGGGLGALGGAPAPVADPETAYATQLQQLQDMGFYDRETNIRALQATGGNVNAAVERLLAS